MNQKITEIEFKKWSEQIFNLISRITSPSKGFIFETEKEREEIIKVGIIGSFWTKEGVLLAPSLGTIALSAARLKNDIPMSEFDGLTLDQWAVKVTDRLREHCIASGYYKPSSPPNLAVLKERRKKVIKIFEDMNELKKLLNYANPEEEKIIVNFGGFLKSLKTAAGDDKLPVDDTDIPRATDFLFEDMVGRVEKLISLKEAAEKPGAPPVIPPNSPNNILETEIENLKKQIESLKTISQNTLDPTQKQVYLDLIKDFEKALADKNQEKNRKQNQEANKNDNKLNIAIGLGAAALVIALICLIVVASRKKERT